MHEEFVSLPKPGAQQMNPLDNQPRIGDTRGDMVDGAVATTRATLGLAPGGLKVRSLVGMVSP